MHNVREFLAQKAELVGGTITAWSSGSEPPTTSEVQDILWQQRGDCYQIVVVTANKEHKFQTNPTPGIIMNTGKYQWTIASPHGGVAVLQGPRP